MKHPKQNNILLCLLFLAASLFSTASFAQATVTTTPSYKDQVRQYIKNSEEIFLHSSKHTPAEIQQYEANNYLMLVSQLTADSTSMLASGSGIFTLQDFIIEQYQPALADLSNAAVNPTDKRTYKIFEELYLEAKTKLKELAGLADQPISAPGN